MACCLDRTGALGLGVGIEDTFVRDVRPGLRRLDEYELTQHDRRWREDLRFVAESGADFLRWGVPWWSVEPREGHFEFGWVDEVAEEMALLGLECVVDLVHYGTPPWLDGSFVDPRYPEAVARYAATVCDRYRSVWRWWTPVNEPMITSVWSGRDGRWPPYLTGDSGFASVLAAVVDGGQRTIRAIRDTDPRARILHVEAGFRWEGGWPMGIPLMDEWRFLATDLLLGRRPAEQLADWLQQAGLPAGRMDDLLAAAVQPDVVGFNYYPGFSTQRWAGEGHEPEAVEAGVRGLVELATAFAERYRCPLALTETSRITTDPGEKLDWLHEVLRACRDELADIDLRGVCWFPFLDMVDWDYREGSAALDDYLRPFGLVSLARTADGELRRIPTPALRGFRSLAREVRAPQGPGARLR